MTDFQILQEILSSGSDVATMGVLWVIWRFDRRILVLETLLNPKKGKKNGQ